MTLEYKEDIPSDITDRHPNEDISEDNNISEENTTPETVDPIEKATRIRLDSMYKNINLRLEGREAQTRFEKLINKFSTNAEEENAFIDALTTAVNDFGDKSFLSSLLDKNAIEREDVVNQKIAEVKNKLPNQIDAIELAAKLSFNGRYMPLGSAMPKINRIAEYLRSDKTAYENEFNKKVEMNVSSYSLLNKESSGYILKLNGENLIGYKEGTTENQENLNKLLEIIKSQIDAGKIEPREVVNRFIEIKNNSESEAELLALLEKGSENGIISYILKQI